MGKMGEGEAKLIGRKSDPTAKEYKYEGGRGAVHSLEPASFQGHTVHTLEALTQGLSVIQEPPLPSQLASRRS